MAIRVPTPFTNNGASFIPPNQYLVAGQSLRSPDGRYHLEVQGDGVAAIYDANQAVWVANLSAQYSYETYNTAYYKTWLVNDYHLFLQDGTRKRTWISDNSDWPFKEAGDYTCAYLQDDGNLVSVTFAVLWSIRKTNFEMPFNNGVLVISPGSELAVNKDYAVGDSRLIFQDDGNLVLYGKDNVVLWASYTQNKSATKAVMQSDGNFVIYDAAGVALWNTGTAGQSGAFAQVQSNGNFVIVSQTITWARFGFTPKHKPVNVFYPDHGTGPLDTYKTWKWVF